MDLTVDLICWRLTQPAHRLAAMAETLSEVERARAAAYRFARHRDEWIAARGGLRRVLAYRLAARPEDLRFRLGPCGRPFLGGSLRFSHSHAGGWAAVALCEGVDPGLDIEAVSPVSIAVAAHHFAPEECARLGALPPDDWQAGFFRCWTRKEAVVKATGRGLSMPLTDFAVNLSPAAPRLLRIRDDDARAWSLWQLPTGPGMAGALAMRNQGRRVNLRFCSGWLGLHHDANRSARENSQGSGSDPGPDGCRSHG